MKYSKKQLVFSPRLAQKKFITLSSGIRNVATDLGLEPRTFSSEGWRAIHCASQPNTSEYWICSNTGKLANQPLDDGHSCEKGIYRVNNIGQKTRNSPFKRNSNNTAFYNNIGSSQYVCLDRIAVSTVASHATELGSIPSLGNFIHNLFGL